MARRAGFDLSPALWQHRPRYAKLAWPRTREFFNRHLKG